MRKLSVFTLIFLATGCATITRGSKEAYGVETTPSGADAEITVNGALFRCVTPCSVKVPRRPPLQVRITKVGFKEINTTVSSSVQGAGAAGMAGNVVLGGLIGAAVDAGTGAMHGHKPNPLVVELEAVPLESEAE